MNDPRIERLRFLANFIATARGNEHYTRAERIASEFNMRIPAEPHRDADLVLSWAADEIERLARERDEAVAALAKAREASFVPGMKRCAKCAFVLTRVNLHVNHGTTSAGDNATEPCPNGCGPLWPMTRQEYADGTDAAVTRYLDERDATLAECARLREALSRIQGWRETDLPEGNRAARAIEYMESVARAALAGATDE